MGTHDLNREELLAMVARLEGERDALRLDNARLQDLARDEKRTADAAEAAAAARQDALALHNETLLDRNSLVEAEVANRTRELSAANEELAAQTEELKANNEELQAQADELRAAYEDMAKLSGEALVANRMKSEFLANMSHELRTPLNSIIGYTELVMAISASPLDPVTRSNLEVVVRNARHLLSLISDVLDLSKIEAGKSAVYASPFNGETLVTAVLSMLMPQAAEHGVSLTSTVDPTVDGLVTDETKVRQILVNLVTNAVKFTHEGRVTVALEARGPDRFALKVSDTGIGIATENLEAVFEEFRQVDASTTRAAGGTGLGLAISRGLARLLGGDLTLESTLGQGTVVTLELPRHLVGHRPAPLSETERSLVDALPADGQGRIVLAIDDEPESLRLIAGQLAGSGYRVVPATTGESGLAFARELKPAAIVLDIMMPRMDGWTVLRELKADPATREIPVVILSFVENKALGFSLGASSYLTKPIDRVQLLAAVRELDAIKHLPETYVLLVEDDPETLALYRQLLAAEGVRTVEATDGRVAADLIAGMQGSLPALTILDLMLPHMDGFEVLACMRANPHTRDVPVIVVTAKDLTSTDLARLSDTRRILPKGDGLESLLVSDLRSVIDQATHKEAP